MLERVFATLKDSYIQPRNMNTSLKRYLKLLPLLLLTLTSGVSLTFAWHLVIYRFADGTFTPGQLDSSFSIASYNRATDTWVNATPGTPLSIYFGEMRTIAELPANNESFIKFKMNDTSVAQKRYNVFIEEINILITNEINDYDLPQIDYYTSLPSQNVFDFYLLTDTGNGLDPEIMFTNYQSMTPFSVTSLNHAIYSSAITLDNWTYIMMKPRLSSIQNIIRQVPVDLSPYSLVFDMRLRGEVTTIDEN